MRLRPLQRPPLVPWAIPLSRPLQLLLFLIRQLRKAVQSQPRHLDLPGTAARRFRPLRASPLQLLRRAMVLAPLHMQRPTAPLQARLRAWSPTPAVPRPLSSNIPCVHASLVSSWLPSSWSDSPIRSLLITAMSLNPAPQPRINDHALLTA
jgi:hypothetical protein